MTSLTSGVRLTNRKYHVKQRATVYKKVKKMRGFLLKNPKQGENRNRFPCTADSKRMTVIWVK